MRIPRYKNSLYHSLGGYLGLEEITDPEFKNFTSMIMAAASELGLPVFDDVNGEHLRGYDALPGTVCGGVQCSTARAFLSPAKDRKNLHVIKNAYVEKVMIDKSNNRTTGIIYNKNGKEFLLNQKRKLSYQQEILAVQRY